MESKSDKYLGIYIVGLVILMIITFILHVLGVRIREPSEQLKQSRLLNQYSTKIEECRYNAKSPKEFFATKTEFIKNKEGSTTGLIIYVSNHTNKDHLVGKIMDKKIKDTWSVCFDSTESKAGKS